MQSSRTLRSGIGGLTALIALTTGFQGKAADATKYQLEFFESKIRPVLSDSCYKCHNSGGKSKGGLILDTREGLLSGGDTGPAIVPGKPEESLLVKAISYADKDLQMPPNGPRLQDSQIADLIVWIKMGAPDPRSTTATPVASKYKGGNDNHWAFQAVKKPEVPEVKMKDWVATPVDAFVLAKLESKGMTPSKPTDKRTLIRRATFDLIGLPPTPEEVNAFLADESPQAFAKVVDRLLASPHYGERWGRYWLDTARYSDTKGDARREDRLYPYAWTYRNYVIDAFNSDKPYNQFLIEQIAADKLPPNGDNAKLAALGFLTLGNRFDNNMNEIINDRIDVVTKGTMAMTVACARCHDHMFDPIPTRDYYSLYGVFSSSIEPAEKPMIAKPKDTPEYEDYLKKHAELEQQLQNYVDGAINKILDEFRGKSAAYMLWTELDGQEKIDFSKKNKLDRDVARIWTRVLGAGGKRKTDPIFGPWYAFAALPEKGFAQQARIIAANVAANRDRAHPYNRYVAAAFRGIGPQSMADVAATYGTVFAKADIQWKEMNDAYKRRVAASTSSKPGNPPTALPDPEMEYIRILPIARTAGKGMNYADAGKRLLPLGAKGREAGFEQRISELDMTHPGAPARAMVLMDSPRPQDSRVFIRGESTSKGEVAPRQFLQVLSHGKQEPFKDGSGRLELARAIASKDNPLTPRVMINRIWMHHFGDGFVTTPDDFGHQSAPPSNPELLDYLAARFMEDGWSIKKIHRLIMLSNVYQQSSENNPRFAQIDPNNSLLWRANIRKLEFEALRDSMLAIGGKLDTSVDGKPFDLMAMPYSTRRTVYAFIDRSDVPEVLNNFDFATPDFTTGKRYNTIVPQQSLFMMNSPLVVEQARNLVGRSDFQAQPTEEAKIKLLYELIYQRDPSATEIKLGLSFVSESPLEDKLPDAVSETPERDNGKKGKNAKRGMTLKKSNGKIDLRPLSPWEKYAHALLQTNEASFVN